MARYVGIDLGTTNSTVSVSNLTLRGDIEAHSLEITQIHEDGNNIVEDVSLPSVLFIDEQSTSYVGAYAKNMSSIYRERVIRDSKRYIGRDVKWTIDDSVYYPDQVASFFLDQLKKQVEKHYNGETIDSAVITIPANFHFQQQQSTRQAAVLAGFAENKIHMIPEPTAALLDFLNEERKMDPSSRRIDLSAGPKNLMVFDLGGGTCDVSILHVSETSIGGIDIQELSISQYMELGGSDFDKLVMKTLMHKYLAEVNMSANEFVKKYSKTMFYQIADYLTNMAERAKKRFSSQVFTSPTDYFVSPEKFDSLSYSEMLPASQLPVELVKKLTLTKAEYDIAVKSLLYAKHDTQAKNIETPILNALNEAVHGSLGIDDITAVFLVGGMTYYPTVQLRIYEIFRKQIRPVQSLNPMLSVSRGAAIYHQKLDMISYSSSDEQEQTQSAGSENTSGGKIATSNIYINVAGGDPVAMMEKGTKLPYEKTFKDLFYVSGVDNGRADITTMRLQLFTAPSAKSMNPMPLQDARIEFKRPVKKNSKLVLKVSCNEEKDVKLRAWLEDDPTEMLEVEVGFAQYTEKEKENIQSQYAKQIG